MDNLTKPQRSFAMSRVRSTNSELELMVFRELRRNGIHFLKHYSRIAGVPDIALPRQRKAIFIHSDFWHGWQFPRWSDKLPNDFWRVKIAKNRARDIRVRRLLRRKGWSYFVLWEHVLLSDFDSSIYQCLEFLRNK